MRVGGNTAKGNEGEKKEGEALEEKCYLERKPKFHQCLKAFPLPFVRTALSLPVFVRLSVSHAWRAFPAPFSSAAPPLNACLACHTVHRAAAKVSASRDTLASSPLFTELRLHTFFLHSPTAAFAGCRWGIAKWFYSHCRSEKRHQGKMDSYQASQIIIASWLIILAS